MSITEEINHVKKEKNAVILAHYYVADEVQEIADYIGDSYYLSKAAQKTAADIIVFCGVKFMGEPGKEGSDAGSDGRLCHGPYGTAGKNPRDERNI